MDGTRSSGIAATFVVLLVGMLLSLGAVEVVVRIGGLDRQPTPPRSDRPRVYYFDERTTGTTALPRESAKPKGVFRIAVIGDSFTFGPLLQVDDLFPARLERLLNLNRDGQQVEVLNFGVSGFSTTKHLTTLGKALTYEPDLVVLQVTLNDPEREPFRARDRARRKAGEDTFWDSVRQYWRTLNFIDMRIRNTRSHQFYLEYHQQLFEEETTWRGFVGAIDRIREECQRANVPLASFLFPMFSFRIDERYPFYNLHKKVEQLMVEQKIPFLDLSRFYRMMPPERLQVAPGIDSHPNEIAHRIAAENMYRQLVRWKLVPAANVARVGLRQRESRPFR